MSFQTTVWSLLGLRYIKIYVRSTNESAMPFSLFICPSDCVKDLIELIKQRQRGKKMLHYGITCDSIFAPQSCNSPGNPHSNQTLEISGDTNLLMLLSAAEANGIFITRNNPIMFTEDKLASSAIYVQSIEPGSEPTSVCYNPNSTSVTKLVSAVLFKQAEVRFSAVFGRPVCSFITIGAKGNQLDVLDHILVADIPGFHPNTKATPLRYRGSSLCNCATDVCYSHKLTRIDEATVAEEAGSAKV